ncbi:hypothetical protein GGF38_000506 [Coemansia sp. RSA 25]|nr:hypothetical protein GGF38_000506 [Coemansia sp. RSA 25]
MGDQAGGSHAFQGLMSTDMQRIAAAYNFDYPFQVAEDSPQCLAEEDSVQRQLAEQFGHGPKAHRAMPQPPAPSSQSNLGYNTALSSAPAIQSASRPLPSQPPSQMHRELARTVMHNMQMAAANRTAFSSAPINQMAMSHSSNGGSSASSEDECGVPKLSSSMAAMSLSGGAASATISAGGKMSDRALNIQKVREASALGKTVAFSKPAAAYPASDAGPTAPDDEDDDDDLVPLGGLKKAGNSSAPDIAMTNGSGVQASMAPQQHAPHGHMYPSPVAYDGTAHMGMQPTPQHTLSMQNLHQQQQHYHYSQHSMHSPSAASVASQMSAPMVMRGAAHQQPGAGFGLHQHSGYPSGAAQQMAYLRGNAIAGGIGSAYSNVGYSRAQGMPDHALHAYTPSPLGQVPIFGQPPMPSHQQPPSVDMRYAQYPPLACRGSLAKNPLMRDINKLKNFSAKDYTAGPTLLAEVDSRQQAKRNLPGLGGATSHSYQPEILPPAPQLQQPLPPPPEPQHQQPYRPYDQADYRDQVEHYPRPDRYEASYHHHRSRSCQNFDEEDVDYSSVSSRTSGWRYHGAKHGGGHKPKKSHRYDHAYGSEHGAMQRAREFRQMASPPSSHDRRAPERRHQRRQDDRYYERYGYEERPEAYAREYYDEFDDDDELDERYGGRYDHRPTGPDYPRRRDAQRRPRIADVRVDRARHDPIWTPPYHGRGSASGRHGYHSRPQLANLDDPRDGDSIIIRSSRPPTGKAGSSDSESLLVLEHGKPRSQFGRILANLKRQTAPFAPMSPKATVHNVQIKEAKVAEARRAADRRIVEVRSENEDDSESLPASAVPEVEAGGSGQPSQTVAATVVAAGDEDDVVEETRVVTTGDEDDIVEATPVPPTPVMASAVPVAAT